MTDEFKQLEALDILASKALEWIMAELQKDFAYPHATALSNDTLNTLLIATGKILATRAHLTETPLLNILPDYCIRLERLTNGMLESIKNV